MKGLNELLEVYEKNRNTLILKVKPNSALDLIANGFDGNESLFRLENRDGYKSYTPFFGEEFKRGSVFEWGTGGCTMASESFRLQRNSIVRVADLYFGFDMD